ncbi:MAG: glycosyltransferase family 39 protein [archaeon]
MKFKKIYFLLGVFFLVKLFFIFGKFHFVLWDEAVYLGFGKYIYSFGNVGLFESIRPPGLPFLLGALWSFGVDYIALSDVLELVFSLGCIYLVYRISRFYFSEGISFAAALIFAITPVFFSNSLRIMTEIPSLFFVLLATYFFFKKDYWLVGLFVGVSFLFKYPYALSLVVFLAALFLNYLRDRNLHEFLSKSLKVVLFFLLAALPVFLVNHFFYGDVLAPLIEASSHGGNLLYHVENPLLNLFFFPYYLFIDNFFFVFSLLSLPYLIKSRKYLFLLFIIIPLVYFTLIVNKQLRFAIIFLPFLSILSSYSLFSVYRSLKSYYRFVFLFLMLMMGFFVLFSDFNVYESFPDEKPDVVEEFYFFLSPNVGPVLTSDPIFAAYSDLKLVPYYDNVVEANLVYDEKISGSAAVVYTPSSFPCFSDLDCELMKSELEEKIRNNKLLFYSRYNDEKYIYLNENYSSSQII